MQAALAKVDGVESVSVDYRAKLAKVKLSKAVAVDDLKSALQGAGYGCTKLE